LSLTTLAVVLIAVGGTAVVIWRQRGWRGRADEAMRLDESLARSLGVAVTRRRIEAFVLSAMFGGLAGTIDALLFSTMLPEKIGFSLIITALTMVIIGGAFSWSGVIVGAIFVTWLPEVLRFGGQWRDVVYGTIVVIMVLFAPDGFVGLVRDGVRALRGRRLGGLTPPEPVRGEA
jgi:branched-chain amino acid transport system permease protein